MSAILNSQVLQQFLKVAGNNLKGDWLLVGGTLLPAVGLDVRATVDIDLVSLEMSDNTQTLELMSIAESLGLPVETINQAAAFFLKKIGYKKSDLIPLHKGRKAMIYRPSVVLYWKLKVGRLSESDLVDCQHYYQYGLGQGDPISKTSLQQILDGASKAQGLSAEKFARIKTLKESLTDR